MSKSGKWSRLSECPQVEAWPLSHHIDTVQTIRSDGPLAALRRGEWAYDPFMWTYDGGVSMGRRQLMHVILTMEPDATVEQVMERMDDLGCPAASSEDIGHEYRLARQKCIATDCMIIQSTGYYCGDSPWMPVEAFLFPLTHRFKPHCLDTAPANAEEFQIQLEATYRLESESSGIDRQEWMYRFIRPLDRAIAKRRLNMATAVAALQVYLGRCRVKLVGACDWKDLKEDMQMSSFGGIRLR